MLCRLSRSLGGARGKMKKAKFVSIKDYCKDTRLYKGKIGVSFTKEELKIMRFAIEHLVTDVFYDEASADIITSKLENL